MKGTIEKSKNQRNKKARMAAQNAAPKKVYKQTKNNKSRNKKLFTKIIITIIIVVLAIALVFVSGFFDVSEIIVEGNSKISKDQIISFARIEQSTNIFAISKDDIENNVKENSYIDDVEVKRCLPNKIKLIVDERKAEYVIQYASSYLYIDSKGNILEISNNKENLPIITGFTTDLSNIKENDKLSSLDQKKLNMTKKIMDIAKNNEIDNLITKIDVSKEENYIIYLDTEGKIAYLGNGNELNIRFLYIKAILKEQQGKSGEIIANVNLNSEYVYFRENR